MKSKQLASMAIAGVLGATLVACSSEPGDAPTVNGGGDAPASDALEAGTAWIEVDGERYETSDLRCSTDFDGVSFAGEAEGPRENARIHGGFDSEMPDLIAVAFDRGDEGEFRALAENELVPHGVLEDYTVDSDALTMSGAAEFGWVNEEGEADLDNLYPGTFQVTCYEGSFHD